ALPAGLALQGGQPAGRPPPPSRNGKDGDPFHEGTVMAPRKSGDFRSAICPSRRLHGAGPPCERMSKPKILIVEDDSDIRELLQYSLAREGNDVAVAADGKAAMTTARRLVPDLVLLDLMLPGVDGLEVCRQLRSDRATAGSAIIMVTAKGEESDVVL